MFYRVIDTDESSERCDEDCWVCEDCLAEFEDPEVIDTAVDEYGDHECQVCGLAICEETGKYRSF